MTTVARTYSRFANDAARDQLNRLLVSRDSPQHYQAAMTELGRQLGDLVCEAIPSPAKCLVASTAEDADFLSTGVMESLGRTHVVMAAVFWNNHYSIPGGSIAPVIHQYLQPGFESADYLIVVKSIISSSCVVRTNLLALIEKIRVSKIFIVAPVVYVHAEQSLRAEFPAAVANLFEFVSYATDEVRDEFTGEVRPGIGGQVYQLLGLSDQPARTGFLPQLVKTLTAI